jgi:hypothetical protein
MYRDKARDDLKVHFVKEKSGYRRAQRDTPDPKAKAQAVKKLEKVRARRYIAAGFVVSLTAAFFAVPKGDDNIRMVYDASVSGLNGAMWVPRFTLPTINTHMRSVEECTFMADV